MDYYWVKDPEERRFQAELFRAQMRLAKRLNLPVIIHDREAHLDCLTIAEQYPGMRGVFHCYSGSTEFAMRLLELGYDLSFTGVLTYKNAKKAVEVVRAVPLERIMIETDAPYMAPVPFRGKRNSSLYVYRMAEAIAEIKELPLAQVPLERIMIETDAPYMAPVPFRGKRNSSLYVYRMAEAIAEIKELPLAQVIEQTTENGKRLFGIV